MEFRNSKTLKRAQNEVILGGGQRCATMGDKTERFGIEITKYIHAIPFTSMWPFVNWSSLPYYAHPCIFYVSI